MKEHPKDCPGDICDEYNCESRKTVLQVNFNNWSGTSEISRTSNTCPQAVVACLNCSPHQCRSPSSRCGKINQFCKNPIHESVLCMPDSVIPKTWKWATRETEHLGEYEKTRFLFDYHKIKVNFGLCGYPPTPTSQWAPCNTDWQLLRNENATMHYIGGRTRVTLRVWTCSNPKMCCTLNANGMEDGFFNFDNKNLFECEFLSMLQERVLSKGLTIPEAFHALSNEFEICHDDMPGLPVRMWMNVLDSYRDFVENRERYTSVASAIERFYSSPSTFVRSEHNACGGGGGGDTPGYEHSSKSNHIGFNEHNSSNSSSCPPSSTPSPMFPSRWPNYEPTPPSHQGAGNFNNNLNSVLGAANFLMASHAASNATQSWNSQADESHSRLYWPIRLQLPMIFQAHGLKDGTVNLMK